MITIYNPNIHNARKSLRQLHDKYINEFHSLHQQIDSYLKALEENSPKHKKKNIGGFGLVLLLVIFISCIDLFVFKGKYFSITSNFIGGLFNA